MALRLTTVAPNADFVIITLPTCTDGTQVVRNINLHCILSNDMLLQRNLE